MKKITLPISDEELATEYLESGANAQDISMKYGVSKPTILRHLKNTKCPMRKMGARKLVLPVTADQLRAEYELPTTLDMMAEKYGCDPEPIRRNILESGGKMRATKEPGAQTIDLPLTDNEIVMMYNTGNTIPQIAEECSCSIPTIHRRLHDNDCKMRTCGQQYKHLVATDEELATKYNAGATTSSLAEKNGCNRNTIRNRLLDHGVVLRARDSDGGRRVQSAGGQGVPIDEWTGFSDGGRPYLTPINQCEWLNDPFDGCDGHHIDSSTIIFIPERLHRPHHNSRNGYGMVAMNKAARDYLNTEQRESPQTTLSQF